MQVCPSNDAVVVVGNKLISLAVERGSLLNDSLVDILHIASIFAADVKDSVSKELIFVEGVFEAIGEKLL